MYFVEDTTAAPLGINTNPVLDTIYTHISLLDKMIGLDCRRVPGSLQSRITTIYLGRALHYFVLFIL